MSILKGKVKFKGAAATPVGFSADVDGMTEYTQLYKHSLTIVNGDVPNTDYYYVSASSTPSTAETLKGDLFGALCVRNGSPNGYGHVFPYVSGSALYVAWVQDRESSPIIASEAIYASGYDVVDVVTKL